MSEFRTKYGYFADDGKEFVITRPDTPRPWINILANAEYGTVISQTGSGYSWWKNSSVARITRWLQDLVKDEMGKYSAQGFLKAVRRLAPGVKAGDILPSDKVGIRAQLVDTRTKKLVMDFVVERGPSSTHILNAISPAFTGSLAFADFVVDQCVNP